MTSSLKGARSIRAPIAIGTGLIALDVVIGPDPTEPPLLMAGGTCGNVLAILSYLGWEAFPVGRLNGDPASQRVKRDLAGWGVSLEFATQRPSVETPIIVQTVRRDRHGVPKHRFSLMCPHCGAWYPSYRAITSAAAVAVTDVICDVRPSGFAPRVFFFDRVSRGALMLAEALSAAGALVVFEPAGIGDPKLFAEALTIADVLKYSHERLPDVATRRHQGEGIALEIETYGAAGLRYRSHSSSSGWLTVAALPAPSLVDTAGAGDWCTAGIIAKLGAGGRSGIERWNATELRNAIRYGQAAAALACAYLGARGAMYALRRITFDRALEAILYEAPSVSVDFPEGQEPRKQHPSRKVDAAIAICAACS